MQWVDDVHLNGSLWEELFSAARWAKMRSILMIKGEDSSAFLSPPGHSWSLWRSLCPLIVLAPRGLCIRNWRSRSISLYKTQMRQNVLPQHYMFTSPAMHSWCGPHGHGKVSGYFRDKMVPRMWTKETRSNRGRCGSYFSRKELKSSHTNRKRSRKRLLLRGQIINLCQRWQPPLNLTRPICALTGVVSWIK